MHGCTYQEWRTCLQVTRQLEDFRKIVSRSLQALLTVWLRKLQEPVGLAPCGLVQCIFSSLLFATHSLLSGQVKTLDQAAPPPPPPHVQSWVVKGCHAQSLESSRRILQKLGMSPAASPAASLKLFHFQSWGSTGHMR